MLAHSWAALPDILDAVSGADDDTGENLVTILLDLHTAHFVQMPGTETGDKRSHTKLGMMPGNGDYVGPCCHLGTPGMSLVAGGSVHRARCSSLPGEGGVSVLWSEEGYTLEYSLSPKLCRNNS